MQWPWVIVGKWSNNLILLYIQRVSLIKSFFNIQQNSKRCGICYTCIFLIWVLQLGTYMYRWTLILSLTSYHNYSPNYTSQCIIKTINVTISKFVTEYEWLTRLSCGTQKYANRTKNTENKMFLYDNKYNTSRTSHKKTWR